MVALVVDGPRGVAVPRPVGHRREVLPGVRLVAEAERDHRRVVLVPLDRALHPVEQRLTPAGVGRGAVDPAVQLEAVRLVVVLEHHVQPELVAQVEQPRVRRVVRCTDGVDVERLHELQVGAGPVLVEHAPSRVVHLVAVDAEQRQGTTVQQPRTVHDLRPPEPDTQRHGLGRGRDRGVVQPWRLRAPRLDGPGIHGRDAGVRLERQVVSQFWDADPYRGTGRDHFDPDAATSAVGVVVGVQPHVLDAARGAPQQLDLAEQPGQPPLVLVLEVRPRGPLPHGDLDRVRTCPDDARHVELPGQPRPASHPDGDIVHDDVSLGFGAQKAKQDATGRVVPGLGYGELPPVGTRRVGVRDVRRIDGERVLHVRVRRTAPCAVPDEHPVRRDGHAAGTPRLAHDQLEVPLPAQVEARGVGGQVGAGRYDASGAGRIGVRVYRAATELDSGHASLLVRTVSPWSPRESAQPRSGVAAGGRPPG